MLERLEAAKLNAVAVNSHQAIARLNKRIPIPCLPLQNAFEVHEAARAQHYEGRLLRHINSDVALLPVRVV
jgi:hypothetical protein